MRIDTAQHLRMTQQMKLAPRMIQSMEILQMAQQALEARIEEELASNPTLELAEASDDASDVRAELQQEERDNLEATRELNIDETSSGGDDFERLSNMAETIGDDWESSNYETGESFARRQLSRTAGERDGKLDAMANTAARGASLYDQLLEQWMLTENDEKTAAAG